MHLAVQVGACTRQRYACGAGQLLPFCLCILGISAKLLQGDHLHGVERLVLWWRQPPW